MAGVHTKLTQNERIIAYMREFDGITQLEALRDIGVMRLASRISDLRKHGYYIVSQVETIKNRYGEKCHIKRYRLIEEESADHCVCCGEDVPEGRQVCPNCEKGV